MLERALQATDIDAIVAALGEDAPKALRDFTRLLFARGPEEDLARYRPEDLAVLARAAFDVLADRPPAAPDATQTGEPGREAKIRVRNPTGGALDHITVIDIVNDNMPFLVDSTMGELTERGLDIRLVLHPILTVTRDGQGRLKSIVGGAQSEPGAAGTRESFIHIHVERLESPFERQEIADALADILRDVRLAVRDWKRMLIGVEEIIADYRTSPPSTPGAADEVAEVIRFLAWLKDNNFTFLGMRDDRVMPGAGAPVEVPGSGLGVLRDPNAKVLMPGSLGHPAPFVVAKSDLRSRVHRRVPLDCIAVKRRDSGRVAGERCIVGLFTSTAYTRSARSIPYIGRKVEHVLARAGFDPDSHSGKALLNVLESYPRDELFQIDEDTLYEFAMAILALDERPRIRVLARPDAFGRFVSVLVYVPRDRYDTEVRIRIGAFLAEALGGHVSTASPSYPEGTLARVHFIIGRDRPGRPEIDPAALEAGVAEIVTTWNDRLRRAVQGRFDPARARSLLAHHAQGFTAAYREAYPAETAVEDMVRLDRLSPERNIAIAFSEGEGGQAELKLYHLATPLSLSTRLPIVENMGFRAIDENSYELDAGAHTVWLHDITVERRDGKPLDLGHLRDPLEALFMAVWRGRAEDDGYNALVLEGLGWRDISVLRAIGRYLRQALIPFSQDYIWATLNRHSAIARLVVELFHARLDPHLGAEREAREAALAAEIEQALQAVTSLDEDRILRRFANVVQAMLRTNYFQIDAAGQLKETLAFKLDSPRVLGLPPPRPMVEVFVYSPRLEAIHLRGGKIARGGIRWSDRPQDFRTEILGLAKAQQVKNAVIVPVGAKGGFVPKHLPGAQDRDAVMAEGVACYQSFIGALLDITDNLDGATVVPPEGVLRRDGDDPYLVVAADKGTASFSDIANGIALSRGFWLGDAFASGGSNGYDHKKMGITARGAWEAVKRHFREMNRDIEREPFTAAGVGDMSGDVFGNGMLLSREIRLVAAFDHRHIFLDPNPDPGTSFAERQRLFDLPRSSWADYDARLISKGGGVFSRAEKTIRLSPEARALLDLDRNATPAELMSAILRAPVDLLWFGGIGTFVRASDETDAEIGDRANDAVRVTAASLSAKVIGEGANLGVSQRGRIEFARRGGRINTDAIDNSAGVNTSDVEVNIKIALNPLLRTGELDLESRNSLLHDMTEEVAGLVLRNNYLQPLAISLTERRGTEDLGFQARLMHGLESVGLLDRAVEFLPTDAELAERLKAGTGLTRPEIAVLLAYAKIALYDALLASRVPDDAYLARELLRYFPEKLRMGFPQAIASHRLRREIIATMLANSMINRGGPTLVVRLADRTGAEPAGIGAAFAAARDSFRLTELNGEIDSLDGRIDGALQLSLYARAQDLLLGQMAWFLRRTDLDAGIGAVVARLRAGIEALEAALDHVLPEEAAAARQAAAQALEVAGVPPALAKRLARLDDLALGPDLLVCAEQAEVDLARAAAVFFALRAYFRIEALVAAAHSLKIEDYYDRLALNRALDRLGEAERRLAQAALATGLDGCAAVEAWAASHPQAVGHAQRVIADVAGAPVTLSRLTVAAGVLDDLAHK